MKKYHLLVFIVSFILYLGTTPASAELQNSFLGYKWGEDISRYDELVEVYSKKDLSFYTNPDELYTIDDIPIGNVTFGFYEESLFAVYVRIDSLETYDKINLHMKLKYGLPDMKTSAKNHSTTFKWKHKGISIKLKTETIEGKMKLALYYDRLANTLKKGELDGIGESSVKFFPIDKNKKPKMVPFLEF